MDIILHELAIKSVESSARNTTRLDSIDLAMAGMRTDYKELIGKVDAMNLGVSRIEDSQRHNEMAHQSLHKDIVEVRNDLDDLMLDHSPCKSLAKGISQNADAHRELAERVETVETNCETCPISGYNQLSAKVDLMSKDLKDLCKALYVVTYSLKLPVLNMPIPIWILFVLLVLMGAAFDVANHWEWLMTAWGVVK